MGPGPKETKHRERSEAAQRHFPLGSRERLPARLRPRSLFRSQGDGRRSDPGPARRVEGANRRVASGMSPEPVRPARPLRESACDPGVPPMSEVNRASHYERKPRTDDDKERRRALYAAHKPRKAG